MNSRRKRSRSYGCAALLALAGALAGCGEGKHPFLIAQICLGDAENLATFTREMRIIAQAENMRFIEGSAETKADLAVIDPEGISHELDGPVIHMGVERGDGMGVDAGNLGLPGYQVALGFSEGSSPDEARRFARTVVSRLARRWHVKTVPPGVGAQPMRGCGIM
jgi:hypothetical protein